MPAMDRSRVVLEEAQKWRDEGRITETFHAWLRTRYGRAGEPESARIIQQVLLAIAAVLLVVGVFTLVSEFWHAFTRTSKFAILVAFAVVSGVAGAFALSMRWSRVVGLVLVALPLPLYLFAMEYGNFSAPEPYGDRGPLLASEVAVLVAGVTLALAALYVGLRRLPHLALTAPPVLLAVLLHVHDYSDFGESGSRTWNLLLFLLVLLIHGALLARWVNALRWPRDPRPFSLRLALAANVPFGFGLLVALTEQWAYRTYPEPPRYDADLVGIILTAVYSAALLVAAIRWAIPELTAAAGLFLIGDAIWLGGDKGGLVGTVVAIFAAAIVLIALAQTGILMRILKPRPAAADRPRKQPPAAPGRPRARASKSPPRTLK